MIKNKVKAYKWLLYSYLVFILVFSFSCGFNPNLQEKGSATLQGKWTDTDTLSTLNNRVSITKFDFSFTCDSFYLTQTTFSKADYYGEKCFNNGTWKEYAKGNYKVINDTLKIEGVFVNDKFRFKAEKTCYRNGKYTEDFILEKTTDSLLVIRSLQANTRSRLSLKQKITCVPKAIK